MDIIINLLKPLFETLAPTSFLGVLSLLVLTVLFTLKVTKYFKSDNKATFFSFLTGQAEAGIMEEEDMIKLQKKLDSLLFTLDTLVSNEAFESGALKVLDKLHEASELTLNTSSALSAHDRRAVEIRNAFEEFKKSIDAEFSNIRHELKMSQIQHQQDAESAKELQQRIHGIIVRTISQVEKADEFMRATIPEFRSYNKDIIKDLAELSTEVTLIERSIRNQVFNNPINLR